MLIIVLAYLGGALTILSPCILPVLPFVFSRADQSFVKSGLPLLAGMGLTFSLKASSKRARKGCLLFFETVNLGCLNNGSRNAGTYHR
ncbi:hypothetical protein [Caballeronia sp. Lep1P3]|uniref:hypothetical protein n=1 Tax=Caballeronia sp. Lep1P3 TaxID=2878150 RepID=UPI001FD18C7F|nr:hypothetical protein [Caballeronia sp. Lep1P3]